MRLSVKFPSPCGVEVVGNIELSLASTQWDKLSILLEPIMRSIEMKRVATQSQMPFDKASVIDFFEGYPRGLCMATCSSDRTYHLGDDSFSSPMPEWLAEREVLIYANQHFRTESWLEMLRELPSSRTRGWDSPTFGVEIYSSEEVERLLDTGYPPEGIYWLFN